jgi:hypothetical protein
MGMTKHTTSNTGQFVGHELTAQGRKTLYTAEVHMGLHSGRELLTKKYRR